MEPDGTHTVERGFTISSGDWHVNTIQLLVKSDEGDVLFAENIAVDYSFITSNDPEYLKRKEDGVGAVAYRLLEITHEGRPIESGATVPVNNDIVVHLHVEGNARYGLALTVRPEDAPYSWHPLGFDEPIPEGGRELYSSFNVSELCSIEKIQIQISNSANITLISEDIDFALTFIDSASDGLNQEGNKVYFNVHEHDRLFLSFKGDEDKATIKPNDILPVGSEVELFLSYMQNTQHGVVFYVYADIELDDAQSDEDEMSLVFLVSSFLITEQEDDDLWLNMLPLDTPMVIRGFHVEMKNTAGEILDETYIEYPLTVVESPS